MIEYNPIAESNNFIVLDQYAREWKVAESYQSEYDLEREFIQDLQNQGYEYCLDLNTPEMLLVNVRLHPIPVFRKRGYKRFAGAGGGAFQVLGRLALE